MQRLFAKLGISAVLLLGLFVVAALTPTSSLAHDPGRCHGVSEMWDVNPNSGTVHHYNNLSQCEMDWDSIGVAAALVRIEPGPNFVLDSIMDFDVDGPGTPWDTGDNDAEVSGDVTLVDGKCYINVGIHAAYEVHVTEGHTSSWLAFSFSPFNCA